MVMLTNNCIVNKSFNNNIVLVKSNGKEKILFSRGIGFNKKYGDIINKGTNVDKIFSIENEDNIRNFKNLVNTVDDDFMAFCEEIIYFLSEEIGEELSENIHIGLIDHLQFAVKRLKNNEEIVNPFLVEIQTLYKVEYKLAEIVCNKVEKKMNIKIPEGETAFIALHIHSARNNGKLSNTIKYSIIASEVIKYVEEALNIKIDKSSLDYARFLTHLRFTMERIMTNVRITNDLIDVIKKRYKISYSIAKEVAKIMESRLEVHVEEDEISYMAMHIERFRVSLLKQ